MERSPLKATNESGVKPNPGGTLDFDDGTLKGENNNYNFVYENLNTFKHF